MIYSFVLVETEMGIVSYVFGVWSRVIFSFDVALAGSTRTISYIWQARVMVTFS